MSGTPPNGTPGSSTPRGWSKGTALAGVGSRSAAIYTALLVLGAAALLQATILARIHFLGVAPNLMLVIVVSWSLLHGMTTGLVWAFVGGLALDLISGMPLGTSSLALMIACLATGIGTNKVFSTNLLFPLLIVCLSTVLYGWSVLLTMQLRDVPVDWITSTVRVIGPELLLNVCLMAITYPILQRRTSRAG